jgi:predicted transcriptional regulator
MRSEERILERIFGQEVADARTRRIASPVLSARAASFADTPKAFRYTLLRKQVRGGGEPGSVTTASCFPGGAGVSRTGQVGVPVTRFGDLEAEIMDAVWEAEGAVKVRDVADQLNRRRRLAFNTVQTVMENLYYKGWLSRRKDGRAYSYTAAKSREDYAARLVSEALGEARHPAATLMRVVGELDAAEVAELRAALDAAAERAQPA